MSMILCTACDNHIDTDDDVEGVFEDTTPFRFWCSGCLQRKIEANEPGCACLAAYKKQDPAAYAEMMEEAEHEANMQSHRAEYEADKKGKRDRQDLIDAGRGHLLPEHAEAVLDCADRDRKIAKGE